MKAYFRQLFDYNLWANRLIIQAFEDLPEVSDKSMRWMSHLVAAEVVWYKRLVPERENALLWDILPLEELKALQEEIDHEWLSWIDAYQGDWQAPITYHNSRGNAFSTPLQTILAHLANHSTHHRGMIVADIRSRGQTPPATDLIFYSRNLQY